MLKKSLVAVGASILTALAVWYLIMRSTESEGEYFGRFSGNVVSEWLEDGRTMELKETLVFEDANGLEWTAPAGRKVNGASIPPILWTMVGSPLVGKYRDASVIHDVYCQDKSRRWESVHLNFYHAMRANNVSKAKANTMYVAVRALGPRWPYKVEQLIPERAFMESTPAKYETVETKTEIRPAREEWVREREARERGAVILDTRVIPNGHFGEAPRRLALIRIPAEYETVTEIILTMPASTHMVTVPAHIKVTSVAPPPYALNEEDVEKLLVNISGDESIELLNRLADKKVISGN